MPPSEESHCEVCALVARDRRSHVYCCPYIKATHRVEWEEKEGSHVWGPTAL